MEATQYFIDHVQNLPTNQNLYSGEKKYCLLLKTPNDAYEVDVTFKAKLGVLPLFEFQPKI